MWLARLGCWQRPPYRLLAACYLSPQLDNYSVRRYGVNPSDKIKSFQVASGDGKLLKDSISSAVGVLKNETNPVAMRREFNREVRPLLVPSCLILPALLDSELAAFLHGPLHSILKEDPMYLSFLDLMLQKNLNGKVFKHLVDYIIAARITIVEDWDHCLGDIEISIYDSAHSSDYYRGESDARFIESAENSKVGFAKLAFVVWKDNEVIWAEVIEHVNCCSVNEAEVLAAVALQLKCLELKVEKLKVFTDSALVLNVISGKHTIEFGCPHSYMLLRHIKEKFDVLVPLLRTRTLMFLTDALLRANGVPTQFDVEDILMRWRLQFEGAPMFRVYQNKMARNIIKTFGKRGSSYKHKLDTVFYLTTEKERKFDMFLELYGKLSPNKVYLVIDKYKEKSSEFQEKVDNFLSEEVISFKKDTCLTMLKGGDPMRKVTDKRRKLVVVFDASLSRDHYLYEDSCTVILTEPQELNLMKVHGIKELSTAAMVQFHGVEYKPLKNKNSRTKGGAGNPGRQGAPPQ